MSDAFRNGYQFRLLVFRRHLPCRSELASGVSVARLSSRLFAPLIANNEDRLALPPLSRQSGSQAGRQAGEQASRQGRPSLKERGRRLRVSSFEATLGG